MAAVEAGEADIQDEQSRPPIATGNASKAAAERGAERPLLTFAVRFYNCAAFVEAALDGALRQGYGPLEILVADDRSTDGTFEAAERIVRAYRGPHRVELFRNERTLGTGGQMEEIRRRMRGEILIVADGDDVSHPARAERVYEAFRDGGPSLMGLDCGFELIDEHGRAIVGVPPAVAGVGPSAERLSAAEIARGRAGPQGAVSAYRRIVLEAGTSLAGVRHSEDRILALRAILLGRLATLPEVLVSRRVHRSNVSGPIGASWSGRELRAWFSGDVKRRIAVAATMRRDVAKLAHDRRIAPEVAARVGQDIASYAREAKLLRVAPKLGACAAWPIYLALRHLGLSRKESVRGLLNQLAPALAMTVLRRNPIVRARSAAKKP